jgi:hypothetical protein
MHESPRKKRSHCGHRGFNLGIRTMSEYEAYVKSPGDPAAGGRDALILAIPFSNAEGSTVSEEG